VVNLASECGYTDEHYKELSALHRDLADEQKEPFAVLGFPSNQFGEQEPHDGPDIEKFAREKYGATFPLFSKIDVTDRDAHPAYRFLESTKCFNLKSVLPFCTFVVYLFSLMTEAFFKRLFKECGD